MNTESQNIEWKESWSDDYLKWVCGFSNAQGGKIYIGKDDGGQVTGLSAKTVRGLLETLPNKFRDKLGLMPAVNLWEEGGKEYLEIVVTASTVPISLRGAYYWRSGSVKQELKGTALSEFLLQKMGLTWDGVIQERASLADIDEKAVEQFKRDAANAGRLPDLTTLSVEETLRKLRVMRREGLTNAALVLFGRDPAEFYPNLFVKIGRFGDSVVEMRFQEVCEGNLITLLHEVMEQLEKKFLVKPIRFEGIKRIEELEYPVPALREILLNALVHRNYLGSMTQVKVMDHSLSVWNAGELPPELSVEKLFQVHESIPRNPLIAEVCYRAGYIDSWGRGIEKISEACLKEGLPEPTLSERTGGVVVELLKGRVKSGVEVSEKSRVETSEKSSVESSVKTSDAILALLREEPRLSLKEVAEKLNKALSGIEKTVAKLKEERHLEYQGSKKSGVWVVTPNKSSVESSVEASEKSRVESRVESGVESGVESRVESRVESGVESRVESGEAILILLREQPRLSLRDVAEELDKALSGVEKAVAKLKLEGRLEYSGAKKNGQWVVKD